MERSRVDNKTMIYIHNFNWRHRCGKYLMVVWLPFSASPINLDYSNSVNTHTNTHNKVEYPPDRCLRGSLR